MKKHVLTTILALSLGTTLLLASPLSPAEKVVLLGKTTSLPVETPTSPGVSVKMVEAHIDLAPFTSVQTDVLANIRFFQSDRHRIEAEGPERVISAIEVKVEGGVLKITSKKNYKLKGGERLTLTIYGQTLRSISQDGVGSFRCSERVETDRMEILSTGVGSVRMDDLQCNKLVVKNDGVGNINLKGKTNQADFVSEGVGTIYAYEMESQVTTVVLNGVGSVQCHASERCDLTSNGVGNIYYKGNPETERVHKNGVGSIRRR